MPRDKGHILEVFILEYNINTTKYTENNLRKKLMLFLIHMIYSKYKMKSC